MTPKSSYNHKSITVADRKIVNLTLELPIRLISEANNSQHWKHKRKRRESIKEEVIAEMSNLLRGFPFRLPCRVTLTRYGAKKMDDDNLVNSFKAVRDSVAKKLGIDDGDRNNVQWIYDQESYKGKEYGIKIQIMTRGFSRLSHGRGSDG
jgi:hypothetical protein